VLLTVVMRVLKGLLDIWFLGPVTAPVGPLTPLASLPASSVFVPSKTSVMNFTALASL
jgi:hypothetical protein